MTTTTQEQLEGLGTYKFGWADSDVAGASARRGLSEEVVRDISARKNEPEWMLEMRLKGLKNFGRKPMPNPACAAAPNGRLTVYTTSRWTDISANSAPAGRPLITNSGLAEELRRSSWALRSSFSRFHPSGRASA